MVVYFLCFVLFVSEPVFSTSLRGKPVILIGDYRYNKWAGSRGDRARWICVKVNAFKCSASLVTINNIIVKQTPHNH